VQQDSHLIFEGWKKDILPTALAMGLAYPAITKYQDHQDNKAKEEMLGAADMVYQDALINTRQDLNKAAELFANYTINLDHGKVQELQDKLVGMDKRDDIDQERAKKLRKLIDGWKEFIKNQRDVDAWAKKDEDAEKVTTEPYLNNANNEEVLTQYQQSWQGAGGGYGKGYGTKGGTKVPNALG
jgi:hypothetical protein|tara:strand:+ start:105 stop:656 length:552 start_codon:yes stop_codon:yes gene_type:complete